MPPASMWSIGSRQPSKYRQQTSSSDPRPAGQGRRLCSMANGRRMRTRVGRGHSDARESPARRPGGAFVVRSVAVGLAAARPDEGEALAVLVVEEVGVNRRVETRVVQLDREVVA